MEMTGKPTLVVGATGWLGQLTVQKLIQAGHTVRAFVRATSDGARVDGLKALGAELVVGDLRDARSVQAACQGVARVVTTASASLSQQPDNDLQSVDEQGQLTLVQAAADAGVERFVYVSFAASDVGFPLQAAKRKVEQAIAASGLDYTVLRPTFFREIWLSPMLGFDPKGGQAVVYGSGDAPVSYIAVDDVASFAARAVDSPRASKATFDLGGPDTVSLRDVIGKVEQLVGRTLSIVEVPETALLGQLEASTHPMDKSRAGLTLMYARGKAIDCAPALEAMPVERQPLGPFLQWLAAPAA